MYKGREVKKRLHDQKQGPSFGKREGTSANLVVNLPEPDTQLLWERNKVECCWTKMADVPILNNDNDASNGFSISVQRILLCSSSLVEML
jgi:hypothetical protein